MLAECSLGQREAGHDERLAGAHHRAGGHVPRNSRERRHIAAADVLGERGLYGAADFLW